MQKNSKRKQAAVLGGAAIGGLFLAAPHASSAALYSASALVFPDGSSTLYSSSAQQMNSSGEVVGYAMANVGPNQVQDAFAFSPSGPIQNIGALGDQINVSEAYALNDSGQVTGEYSVSSIDHAFTYSTATQTITDISLIDSGTTGVDSGTASVGQFINASGQIVFQQNNSEYQYLPGGTPAVANIGDLGGGVNFAYAMNNAGQIIGYSNTSDSVQHAMLYYPGVRSTPGTMVNLTPTDADSSTAYAQSEPTAGHASGVIVGVRNQTTNPTDFYYQDGVTPGSGTAKNLSLGGQGTGAIMVNSSGQIAGTSFLAGNTVSHAFFFDTNGVAVTPTDVGSLSGPSGTSAAAAINSAAQIVGSSTTSGGAFDAFIWSKTAGMTDLGNLASDPVAGYSEATAVNDSGMVVGDSNTAGGQDDAFVWTADNGIQDLNSLLPSGFFTEEEVATGESWYLTAASSINDQGDIMATATDTDQDAYIGVLLNPVPEPTTLSLLVLGAVGLLTRRRR